MAAPQQKVDVSKLTEEEKKVYQKYGKLPTGKDLLGHKLKDRKYFDSGDYAMNKAGKTTGPVGTSHPSPENIPHSNPDPHHSSSPAKESSLVHEAAAAAK
ncbi:MAG: camp-regulated phosphoprotein/endosulfine conserved region-domain-containing protein [Olpidium bornovanus]|uniref:mRNA stability protein n=1 Tax=Olpidium bornovanus TaxID=278681 RepID=A0A8H7ZXL0_9FUNG|nr:MAG: camp-regulated phosphoprotein/endosulfine conserved region-domain-containing protein [Olpidium bornovanus]